MALKFNLVNGETMTVNGFTLPQVLEKITEFGDSGFIQIEGTDGETGTPKTNVIFNKHIVTIEES